MWKLINTGYNKNKLYAENYLKVGKVVEDS